MILRRLNKKISFLGSGFYFRFVISIYNFLLLTRVIYSKTNTYLCQKLNDMNTKLTLTIEKEVIEIAKEFAKEKGQSLSEMVENYFKFVTTKRIKIKEDQISPKVRKLRGIIKTDVEIDYKQILTEELSKKYGV